MKLREFLQQQGLSRRTITSSINDGTVFLNGEKVESYGIEISSGDIVAYVDKQWTYTPVLENKKPQMLLFYKPLGYVCSKSDPHNETIYDILPEIYRSWYYLGRLDKDSRGLVLLTDDPKFVDQYEHPRHGITKEYIVTLHKPFRQDDSNRCLEGIQDEEDLLKCVECQILDSLGYQQYQYFLVQDTQQRMGSFVRMVLNEGKKRHIRRMMSGLRYHVEDLVRIREGEFDLTGLQEGDFRVVSS